MKQIIVVIIALMLANAFSLRLLQSSPSLTGSISASLGIGTDLVSEIGSHLDQIIANVQSTLDARGQQAVNIANRALQIFNQISGSSIDQAIAAINNAPDRIQMVIDCSMALATYALQQGQTALSHGIALAAQNLQNALENFRQTLNSSLAQIPTMLSNAQQQVQSAYAQGLGMAMTAEDQLQVRILKSYFLLVLILLYLSDIDSNK